jgi:methylglutaconyl-CoA hydratase
MTMAVGPAASGVARFTLRFPETGNAVSAAVLRGILEALTHAEADPGVRAFVIDSEGKNFSSGIDLSLTCLDAVADADRTLKMFADTLLRLVRSRVPVIAFVEGKASGGGLGLVAACDIVIASESAEFALPEVILGMVPAVVAPVLLRRVTPGRLAALALSSRTVPAREARELGIVDEIGGREALRRQLLRIGRSSPEAIAETKRMIDSQEGGLLDRRLADACLLQSARIEREDIREGIRMFAEGFSPSWFRHIGES